jgi:hypothetical protein
VKGHHRLTYAFFKTTMDALDIPPTCRELPFVAFDWWARRIIPAASFTQERYEKVVIGLFHLTRFQVFPGWRRKNSTLLTALVTFLTSVIETARLTELELTYLGTIVGADPPIRVASGDSRPSKSYTAQKRERLVAWKARPGLVTAMVREMAMPLYPDFLKQAEAAIKRFRQR